MGRAQIIILVIVAVIGFKAPHPFAVEDILQVEITDKLVGVQTIIPIAEIPVKKQPVVEQPRRKRHVDLYIREIPPVAAEGRGDVPVVGNLP